MLVSDGATLAAGLATGDARYAPWLARTAEQRGWTDVIVFDGKVTHRLVGERFDTTGDEPPPAGPRPATVAGLVMVGVGSATGAVGLGINIAAYQEADPTETDGGRTLVAQPDASTYQSVLDQNRAGFFLALGGAAVGVAGVVITAISAQRKTVTGAPDDAAAAPWVVAGPDGAAVGIGGRF